MLRIYFILLFSFSVLFSQIDNSKYIWIHDEPNPRNEYVYFRNDFNLNSEIELGEIHLYADSRYQIFVNEVFLGFGPARSYPQNPEYDSYNLTHYLREGKNVIAVKALYNGIENFQVPENRPGFIAWGIIKTKNKIYELNTPGKWLCRKSEGYDQNAVRFSFACAAMEVFDARKENYDWKKPTTDLTNWSTPIAINDQKAWGRMTERSIPHLTKNEILAKSLIGAYKINLDKDIYSFRVKTPDEKRLDYNQGRHIIAYTYIFSPIEQNVEVGLWWGEYYLNGNGQLKGLGENSKQPNRNPHILSLKKGWNFLNMHYGGIWGAWDFYMDIPKDANLNLSPNKDLNSDISFMSTGPYEGSKNKNLKTLDRPFNSAEDLIETFDVDWRSHKKDDGSNNPALDMVWNSNTTKLDINDWETTNLLVPKNQNSAYVFDIGGKTLAKYFIEIDAPKGTVIDIGISEDLNNGKVWLFKRKMISAASRFISDGKNKWYETFKPYGYRYLQVNINKHIQDVSILKVGAIEQIYPFEKIGSFRCSDPIFNSIWELGWRTLRVCAEDSYIDTPFRERGLYAGDMLPEYAITLTTSGDSRLLKRSLKFFHDQYHDALFEGASNRHEDFLLINILSSKWYYDYTEDKEIIEFVYDGYKALMQKWWDSRNEEGIMFIGRSFIEWTQIDKEAKLTASHALYSKTLDIMDEYAKILNLSNDAKMFKRRAQKVQEIIKTKFWDKEKQLFNDGFKDDLLQGKYYPTSNAWPLLFDCTTEDQSAKIISFLEDELNDIGEESRNRRITPYSSFYTLAALYQNERADIAEKFIKQYWTRMILRGDDTAWENFDIASESEGGGQGTASHAWSGHPTYFLSSEALGVNLGFNKNINKEKIIISPQSETLSWVEGQVPHPLGIVKVSWRVEGDNLFLNYSVPKGCSAEIIPRGRLAQKKLFINQM